ncbi:unnamed protein product [Vicia faba]|uniref:Uncharacterized protein n=1 Tax=Vicia faba TaxID=3906 RepID=A0AAV1AFM6_VICFA|nr:unnamed protein product [Vicia faba]
MLNNNNGSFENMEPQTPTPTPASSETSHTTKPLVDNVDDYEYIYVTEELSACYTTEWDAMFESARAPMCEDLSTYFFNPLKPQLPLNVLIPSEPQNTSVGGDNLDSCIMVVDESHNQIMDPVDTATADSSLKPKKRGRPKKFKCLIVQSDVDAGSSVGLRKGNQLNEAPKKKRFPKSK